MTRLLALALSLFALNANALKVDGIFKQGGVLDIEYNEQKTKSITINDKLINLDGDGIEYYAVGRNVKNLKLKQTLKNGTIVLKNYPIEKQRFKVQHIKGVKKEHVTPKAPELLARIGKEYKEIRASRVTNDNKYFAKNLPQFVMPTSGIITGVFGSSRTYNGVEKSWHKGLDIANKKGTLVTSPMAGKVVLAMEDSFYNGNLLIIDHGKKIYSVYAHLCDILVKDGETVKVGVPIGKIGTTGRSTGPHLHWGVYVGQQAVNPKFLLKEEKDKV